MYNAVTFSPPPIITVQQLSHNFIFKNQFCIARTLLRTTIFEILNPITFHYDRFEEAVGLRRGLGGINSFELIIYHHSKIIFDFFSRMLLADSDS